MSTLLKGANNSGLDFKSKFKICHNKYEQIILPKAPFFLIRLFTSLHVVMHSERARQVGRGETESEGERNLGTNPLHSLITISDVCGMPMNQPYDVCVAY